MAQAGADSVRSPSFPSREAAVSDVRWDTTSGSVVHRLYEAVDRIGRPGAFSLLKLYLVVVGVTYLPLIGAALSSSLPIATPTDTLSLPFLLDLNILYMSFVSLPCLAVLSASDQAVLTRALDSVRSDGTITIAVTEERRLAARWFHRCRALNLVGLGLGTIIGLVIAYLNFITYTPPVVGFWAAENGRLLPVGYVFLYSIFLFYVLVPIYIVRNVTIALLLRDIVRHAELHMLPLHPDKSGGLRPVGRMGLRNQYALSLLGVNVVIFVIISTIYLHLSIWLNGLIVAAIIAYLILGPFVFLAPLLPFRDGMLKSKAELMGEVARRMRVELERLRAQLRTGEITKEDEELVERLRKIGAVIDELPVWPFDAGTLRRFLTAYVIPIIGAAGYPAVRMAFDFFGVALPF